MTEPDKTGILLTAFGTSVPGADSVYYNIQQQVREVYPDIPIYWAYTSQVIREKLKNQGKPVHSPVQALSLMAENGLEHVAMQSLLIIPGLEHHDLIQISRAIQGLPKGIKKIVLGNPLLSHSRDLQRFAAAMMDNISPSVHEDEAIILMGHGSVHPANVYYSALQYHFWLCHPNIFVGAVEGTPSLEEILPLLQKNELTRARLYPLMVVAGEHAINDMAGRQTDSWITVLSNMGIDAKAVMKGLGSFENINEIWLDHLREIMGRL